MDAAVENVSHLAWLTVTVPLPCHLAQERFTVSFASIRFRIDTITLPLSKLEWRSLKTELRQHSLPKV